MAWKQGASIAITILSTGLGLVILLGRLVCDSAASPPAQAIELVRGPYLQWVTTDSIVIAWDTNRPADSQVDYGLAPDYGWSAADPALTRHHALTLTGLRPYTLYHYQVLGEGAPLGPAGTFRTAAPPTQTAFSFVAFGDSRSGVAEHRSVVARILTLAPDLVLHTGDIVNKPSEPADWDLFFEIERDLMRQITLFPALGNHEREHADYFDAFHLPNNERWYSFDYGQAHFTVLQADGYAVWTRYEPQYAWLENDLAASSARWKIVMLHYPPYSSGLHSAEAGVVKVRKLLAPMFERYGVDLVISGHDHDYERSVVNGVTYIVSGGGGAPLYPRKNPNPYSVYFSRTLHAVSFTIAGNTLSGVGVLPDGTLFDPFTITRPIYIIYLGPI